MVFDLTCPVFRLEAVRWYLLKLFSYSGWRLINVNINSTVGGAKAREISPLCKVLFTGGKEHRNSTNLQTCFPDECCKLFCFMWLRVFQVFICFLQFDFQGLDIPIYPEW